MRKQHPIVAVVFIVISAWEMTSAALGSFTFDVQQQGGNVLVTGDRTINTSALIFTFNAKSQGASIGLGMGQLSAGPVSTVQIPYSAFTGISGPSAFGPGDMDRFANFSTGDSVGIAFGSTVAVPSGYFSGTTLTDSSTFEGFTFASLGLTLGSYVYTWGSGATADSLTINIGVVPEPASLAVVGIRPAPPTAVSFGAMFNIINPSIPYRPKCPVANHRIRRR